MWRRIAARLTGRRSSNLLSSLDQRVAQLEQQQAALIALQQRVDALEQQLTVTQDRLLQAIRNTIADVTDQMARPPLTDLGDNSGSL